MAAAKKHPNCRVVHFGDKWWSIAVHIDIDHLKMCYAKHDVHPPQNRWFHIVEHLLGMPRRLYLDSGVQQTMARKIICEKISATIQERYGDYLDKYPFDFADLVFVFDTVTLRAEDNDHPLLYHDRVLS